MINIGEFFLLGVDVLATKVSDATNKVLALVGSVTTETTDADNAEWIQHVGFASRPSKAEPGKQAAQAYGVRRGSGSDVVLASTDERGRELYGNLADGETCLYAGGEDGKAQGRSIYKGDGSVTHFTTDTNTAEGRSVYSRVAPDGFLFVAPWGKLVFDETGFHVSHKSGAKFSLGGIHGMPAPLDQIASYVRLQAGTINGKASVVSFGAAGVPKPLPDALALKAVLLAMAAKLSALGAPISPAEAALIQSLDTSTSST